jgi:hypothetical protein
MDIVCLRDFIPSQIIESSNQYPELTVDEILDKIYQSRTGKDCLNWNERVILCNYQSGLYL